MTEQEVNLNPPRNVGYSKSNSVYFQGEGEESILKSKNSIYTPQSKQKDLFIMAYALGIKYGELKEIDKKDNNVSVEAMTDEQKWLILASQISETKGIDCLINQPKIYSIAEEYANSGIKILKSEMDESGINYPTELEVKLRRILGLL